MTLPDLDSTMMVTQRLRRLLAMQETWVQSLGWKIPWRRKWQSIPVFLAWRIPWTEELGGLQSRGHKESDTTERLHFHFQDPISTDIPKRLGRYVRAETQRGE